MLGIRKRVCTLTELGGRGVNPLKCLPTWELAKHTQEQGPLKTGSGGKFMFGSWERWNTKQSLLSMLLLSSGNC